MTYSVYQHWDPLKTCIVGRSYPPEFYSWMKISHVRDLFERIAQETEEDFQAIIRTLEHFNVKVMRPNLDNVDVTSGKIAPPPMTPRDTMIMIGQTFHRAGSDWSMFYSNIKDASWPWYDCLDDFLAHAETWQIREAQQLHNLDGFVHNHEYLDPRYSDIFDCIKAQGNRFETNLGGLATGSMVSRIGKDLYFATEHPDQNKDALLAKANQHFPHHRNHIVDAAGHGDAVYCPVCPGLIVSLQDVPTYQHTFPDWEVLYLPGQSWDKVQPFMDLKKKNSGRWWIPGFEYDDAVIDMVEVWLSHWVGYVEETVFDVNMLIIDPKNVMMFNHNQTVFDALARYGITPHVVPFRHRYFWDGGIHCVTLDLDREGHMQDFFPQRGN